MISPTANPPVCKVLDYNKFKYEQTKREKELKKNQKVVELKTIQLSMTIDENDMKTKAKAATKWLAEGNKVKISLRMVGRQMAYSQNAVDVVNKFCAMLPAAKVEKFPLQEGRYINMIIAPQSAK
jgi:translation initiation factor IF-3